MDKKRCTILAHLGENVGRLRLALGWTQRELGDRLGSTERHAWNVEHGRANLRMTQVEELAGVLGTTAVRLLSPPE